jgi:hypothetical protein
MRDTKRIWRKTTRCGMKTWKRRKEIGRKEEEKRRMGEGE